MDKEAARVRGTIIDTFNQESDITPVAVDIDHWKWRHDDVSLSLVMSMICYDICLQKKYMSLVVHCVTGNGERAKVECGIKVSSLNSPTAASTGRDLKEQAESFGLDVFKKFMYVVTDGASVMNAIWGHRFPGAFVRWLFSRNKLVLQTTCLHRCSVPSMVCTLCAKRRGEKRKGWTVHWMISTPRATRWRQMCIICQYRSRCDRNALLAGCRSTCSCSTLTVRCDHHDTTITYRAENVDKLRGYYQHDDYLRHEAVFMAVDKVLLSKVTALLAPFYKCEYSKVRTDISGVQSLTTSRWTSARR